MQQPTRCRSALSQAYRQRCCAPGSKRHNQSRRSRGTPRSLAQQDCPLWPPRNGAARPAPSIILHPKPPAPAACACAGLNRSVAWQQGSGICMVTRPGHGPAAVYCVHLDNLQDCGMIAPCLPRQRHGSHSATIHRLMGSCMETHLSMQGSSACSEQRKPQLRAHLDSAEVADELMH